MAGRHELGSIWTRLPCIHMQVRSFRGRSGALKSIGIVMQRQSFIRYASSASHESMETFLSYAKKSGLDQNSTVYVGTLYEYLCLKALKRFGFALERVGGRGDEGVDLIGTWRLPSEEMPLNAIVQCKALRLKAGPALVRELEGALARTKPGSVAVLCSQKSATKGVRDAIKNANVPLIWMQIVQDDAQGAKVHQMLWNVPVQVMGARGLDVTVKREGATDELGEIALLWENEIWSPG